MNRRKLLQAIVLDCVSVLPPLQQEGKTAPVTNRQRPHNMARLAAECAKLDPAEEQAMAEGVFPIY